MSRQSLSVFRAAAENRNMPYPRPFGNQCQKLIGCLSTGTKQTNGRCIVTYQMTEPNSAGSRCTKRHQTRGTDSLFVYFAEKDSQQSAACRVMQYMNRQFAMIVALIIPLQYDQLRTNLRTHNAKLVNPPGKLDTRTPDGE